MFPSHTHLPIISVNTLPAYRSVSRVLYLCPIGIIQGCLWDPEIGAFCWSLVSSTIGTELKLVFPTVHLPFPHK